MPNNDNRNGNGNYSKPLETVAIPTKIFWWAMFGLASILGATVMLANENKVDMRLMQKDILHELKSTNKSIERLRERIRTLEDNGRKPSSIWGGKGKAGKPTGLMPTEHTIDEPKPMPLPPWPIPKPDKPETVVCKSKTKPKENCSI